MTGHDLEVARSWMILCERLHDALMEWRKEATLGPWPIRVNIRHEFELSLRTQSHLHLPGGDRDLIPNDLNQ